jgi:hypothetical protein
MRAASATEAEEDLVVAVYLYRSGFNSGYSFFRLRQALGYRGADLGHLLDVRIATISKWENTDGPVSRAAWVTLGTLVEDRLECSSRTEDRLVACAQGKQPTQPVDLEAPWYRPDRPRPRRFEAKRLAPRIRKRGARIGTMHLDGNTPKR